MQGTTPAYLFIGLIAGLVSALMFAAAQTGSALFLLLFFVIPVPIYLAGLGWGAISALAGAISGASAIAVMANVHSALFFLLSVGVAPVLISHFALKSRASLNEDGSEGPGREWYPEGRLVLISAAFIAGAVVVAVFTSGISPADLVKIGEELTDNWPKPPAGIDPQAALAFDQLRESMKRFAPHMITISAVGWTVFVVIGWALAAKILSAAGRNVRTWAPFHKLDFPRTASVALAVAVLASFMTGQFGLIGSAALAALLTAFFILGLACVHGLVAKSSARLPLLFGLYAILLIFHVIAAPAVLLLGLAEHIAGLRARFAGITPTPS
ncbi:MAG: DUF2232 domain-containing protein [Pseudomonadota bacterium]